MPNDLLSIAAHPAGRTFLAFSRDGNILYTGGSDSLVRIWKAESGTDEEPDIALDADEPITALTSDNDGWLSGSEDSQVRRYLKTATDMNALITRTNAVPVRSISVDPKGHRVAVASDEIRVKLIDLGDTTQICFLEGHKRSVRSATWHPTEPLLTTCGSDGKVIAWDLSGKEPKIEKIIGGIIPEVSDTESDAFGYECAAVWHPSGSYFVIAGVAHEIVMISRSTWSKISSFTNDDCIGVITAMAISVNGVYLASACKSGIFVWSTTDKRVIVRYPISETITVHQLSFSSSHNILAWTDSKGMLTRWPGVIPAAAQSPVRLSLSGASASIHRQATPLYGLNDQPEDTEHDLDDKGQGADLEEHADWIIDDLGTGTFDKVEKDFDVAGLREMVSVTRAQPAFQPGATPFYNRKRYLSYNSIGLVEVVDQDTHQIVDVSFHDQTTRKNYHFTDSNKYDMASVGERGVIYACSPEAGHPASILYKPYSTWATNSEWTYSFPIGERVVAVAAGGTPPTYALRLAQEADIEGNGYVAVATDAGIVRFFTGGGLQRGPVWAVDGDIVSMVAGRDYLFLIHREGGTSLDGNQNLKYTLRTSDTFRVMHTGRLPINKGHTLKWIGISDEGAPVIYDSSERLMILEHYRFTAQGSWAVLLDAKTLGRRAGKDESYWPISISKSTMTCIILKGRAEYPGFPRPLPQEVPMNMPYLEVEGAEAQRAERISRETIFLDYIRDSLEDDDALTTEQVSKCELELDKELIQIIQVACKKDNLQRALDAVKLLHHAASLELAIKVAEFYHLAGLHEKIGIIRSARENVDRLHNERARRQEWREVAGFVPQAPDIHAGASYTTPKPFQDARPTPSVFRPRLAAAKPSTEPSPFSQKPTMHRMDESSSSHTLLERSPPPPEKRKRDDIEVFESPNSTLEVECASKRQAANYTSVKANPFAKPAENNDDKSNSKPNPFARKTDFGKALRKSDSFFEKVNVAENEAETVHVKRRKKQVMKQTTLFGLPLPDTLDRESLEPEIPVKSCKDSMSRQFPSEEKHLKDSGLVDMDDDERIFAGTEATQEATMVDGDTQLEEERCDEEEPIEWPPSPSPAETLPMASEV